MKGFINLLKPTGMSSAYAVGGVKRKLKSPCGHMGTLDPLASGVLPVGIGRTSRLFPFLIDKTKTYVADFRFGEHTDTLDVTGELLGTTEIVPTLEQIKQAVKSQIGEIEQIPPKYSAKNIAGKRAYQLSRQGVEFELQPKKVNIYDVEVLGEVNKNEYRFKIVCGGGTYIRSIGRDLASDLGSLAVMSRLERTQSGVFTINNGVSVDEFINSDNPEKYLISSDSAVNFPKLILDKKRAQKILDGVFDNLGYQDGLYRVYCENERDFWGVGQSKDGILKIISYIR